MEVLNHELDRTAQTGTTQIDEAQSNLDRISEVRPVDITLAQAEVNHAIALLKRAETDLDRAYLRAPITGQILKIHTRAGEKQHSKGIVELAQTNTMIAIAEVYQTDIAKVQPGQLVTLTILSSTIGLKLRAYATPNPAVQSP